ncbi:hypothetical protein XELAEV_18008071mg [Xenopus laevis]|uniref:Uncharacterized protein n=1 Tax=Xenopus laevis TaxID=8355 RepID=A0A974E2I9_XENLA|nr:hypothetical protein XELAEV_18008071mg [Xenopus laevis]
MNDHIGVPWILQYCSKMLFFFLIKTSVFFCTEYILTNTLYKRIPKINGQTQKLVHHLVSLLSRSRFIQLCDLKRWFTFVSF